ncbi:WD40 repeat domain-containing protein [Dactylosporangium sp. CA-092794]|uniref:WD40 repeat domain-containing protein n=1 Tax=Dactylosporangium sp. CA-092794 TaxID=3239929 RepID=UPI003D8CA397
MTGHTGPVRSVAIAPDGTWLATTDDDREVRMWGLAPRRQPSRPRHVRMASRPV